MSRSRTRRPPRLCATSRAAASGRGLPAPRPSKARREQHERAAAFLRRLERPLLVIPGNHDTPWAFPARFTRPFREFERQWETTEPIHRGDGFFVVGLNSVRPWRHQSGGVRSAQLQRAAELLATAPEGSLRVVALHHPLIGAPWRPRKKPVP